MERWVEETLHDGFRVRLKADKVFFDSKTEHQQLIIFENEVVRRRASEFHSGWRKPRNQ